jgi:DNA polymerase delta subunit 1
MEVVSVEYVGETAFHEYVYDIETEDGTYVAGSTETESGAGSTETDRVGTYGGILVKNTDSCYVKFDLDKDSFVKEDGEFDEQAYMKENFRLAQECADRITKTFKKPIDLEFEKFMYPFFLYQKKRYAYQEWTEPDKPHENLEYKGLSVVRRDYCPYVKEVCHTLFEILMKGIKETIEYSKKKIEKLDKKQKITGISKENEIQELKERIEVLKKVSKKVLLEKIDVTNSIGNTSVIEEAIVYVKGAIKFLFEGKVPIEKLIISNSLRGTYKHESKDVHWTDPRINKAHVKLAQKIKELDPVNHPKPPDRVPYVFIVKNGAKLQWERVEHPDYLGSCKIDTLYYFDHQLRESIMQIFDLMVEDTDKIYEELRLDKINEMNGQKPITSFFKVTKKKKQDKIVLKNPETVKSIENSQSRIHDFKKKENFT